MADHFHPCLGVKCTTVVKDASNKQAESQQLAPTAHSILHHASSWLPHSAVGSSTAGSPLYGVSAAYTVLCDYIDENL